MSLVPRSYPDIVRDVLTTLTQGVTGETHRVSYDPLARPVVVPDIVLRRRPVRRVSFVAGKIAAEDPEAPPVEHVFALSDYELVGPPERPEEFDRLRFTLFGRKPAPDTDIVVNYYPRSTDPTPLTDLNVGSVTRTLVEALSHELGLLYAQLNLAYESAFVETATGSALDRVVALLGYQRYRGGRPTGTVEFTRRAGAVGNITVPAGTPVSDSQDTVRYLTAASHLMLAGETTALVPVRGASAATPTVEAGALSVIQTALAGLERVSNPRPTARASEDESDEELRARARDALLAANKGTAQAIRHGLLQMPEVRDAQITEMPNGVPGEIRVAVSLAEPSPDGTLPPAIRARIDALRPAGVRVLGESAGRLDLAAELALVLAGSGLPEAETEQLRAAARKTLAGQVAGKGVGETIRIKPLVAALLGDPRIVDAGLRIGAKGATIAEADFAPPPGTAVALAAADIAFAPERFEAAAGEAATVPIEVTAEIGVTPAGGVPLDQVRTTLGERLATVFAALSPGASVTGEGLLNALREDSLYAIDPTRLVVSLTAADRFVQVAPGLPAFQVLPGHVFHLGAVEVSA